MIHFFTFILLLSPFCETLLGADIGVTAIGTAVTAKDALLAAKRIAVEKGIGSIIFAQSEVNNFMLAKEVVISKTMGAIKKVDIIKERLTADGLVEITISAVGSKQRINEDLYALGILMESMDKPRVMVLVNEEVGGKRSRVCETAIIEQLQQKRFNLIDPELSFAFLEKKGKLFCEITSSDIGAIVQGGLHHGAEVIIVGKVSIYSGEKMYGLHSAQVDLFLQALLCSNGKIISAKNFHAANTHLYQKTAATNAIKKATANIFVNRRQDKTPPSLLDDIIAAWQNAQNNGLSIKLIVDNINEFTICGAVEKKFKP
jgi:hypothetical protein